MPALPTIHSANEAPRKLKIWQQQLNPVVNQPKPAATPFNFQAAGGASGVLGISLSWNRVPGADGYQIQMSPTGDFSSAAIIATLTSPVATSYFDNTVQSSVTRYYRIRSTSGTTNQPQSVQGIWSAPISQTSGSATTSYDTVSGSSGNAGWNRPLGGRARLNTF